MFIYTKAEIVPLDNLDLKPKIAITEWTKSNKNAINYFCHSFI
jgi:hypothetical protein